MTVLHSYIQELVQGIYVKIISRGRPWRYSVIPSTPDFQTEYHIRRNSNPAGLPVFTAIWGPGFMASIITLAHMLKQIKQITFTLMTMFKVNTSPPNEVRLICTQRRVTNSSNCCLVMTSMHWAVCFEGATPDFQTW